MTLSAFAPVNLLSTYAPTLINSYGYKRLEANALVSVGSWVGLVGGVLLGILAYVFFLYLERYVNSRFQVIEREEEDCVF